MNMIFQVLYSLFVIRPRIQSVVVRVSAERGTDVYYAELADQINDYEEMVKRMKHVAEMRVVLSPRERKLFRTAYIVHITQRRDSWDTVSILERKEESEDNAALINGYKRKIETEITNICTQVLSIIHEYLIPSSRTHAPSLVFYHTMRGDCYRYQAEIKTSFDRLADADLALQAYTLAMNTADQSNLSIAHPARLGLALNLALFQYEILGDTQRAYNVVQQALDGDVAQQDLSDVEEQLDSLQLMSRLTRKRLEFFNRMRD